MNEVGSVDVEAPALERIEDAGYVRGYIREAASIERRSRERRAGQIRRIGVYGGLIDIADARRHAALFHVAEEVSIARRNHQFRSRRPIGAKTVDRVGIGVSRI